MHPAWYAGVSPILNCFASGGNRLGLPDQLFGPINADLYTLCVTMHQAEEVRREKYSNFCLYYVSFTNFACKAQEDVTEFGGRGGGDESCKRGLILSVEKYRCYKIQNEYM